MYLYLALGFLVAGGIPQDANTSIERGVFTASIVFATHEYLAYRMQIFAGEFSAIGDFLRSRLGYNIHFTKLGIVILDLLIAVPMFSYSTYSLNYTIIVGFIALFTIMFILLLKFMSSILGKLVEFLEPIPGSVSPSLVWISIIVVMILGVINTYLSFSHLAFLLVFIFPIFSSLPVSSAGFLLPIGLIVMDRVAAAYARILLLVIPGGFLYITHSFLSSVLGENPPQLMESLILISWLVAGIVIFTPDAQNLWRQYSPP